MRPYIAEGVTIVTTPGNAAFVRETLAMWLPNERILFTGDVIETGYAETARWDGKGKLADILARYRWNVETIATAHSRTRKLVDMRPPS